MENQEYYQNVNRYNLIGLALEEYKKAKFTYMLIIVDTSIPVLEPPKNADEWSAYIVRLFKWNLPGMGEFSDRTIDLHNSVNIFRSYCNLYKKCKFFVVKVFEDGQILPSVEFVNSDIEILNNEFNKIHEFLLEPDYPPIL